MENNQNNLWTRKRPTEPGYYWIRTLSGDEAGYRLVYKNNEGNIMEASPLNWAGYWWPIPIKIPDFVTDDGDKL